MTGYAIRVDELERSEDRSGLLFVEREDAQNKYAIPSAYVAYTKYLNIKLGNEKFVNNAPAAVLEMERKKQADAESIIKSLKESIAALKKA